LLLVLAFGLTGCLDAQTSIHFDSPYRGEVVQHIQLGSQLAAAQSWLDHLAARAKTLDSKVQRPAAQELLITLPFTNAADLETKFNQLVSPVPSSAAPSNDMPTIAAHLTVKTNNLLLFQRNRLIYDIDLTSLGLSSAAGDTLLDTNSGIDLRFGVAGPWGARGRAAEHRATGQTLWTLTPGAKNHIEATLWMPSPIGLGTVAIVGLVMAGTYYLRKVA
jgi:hypothetical protein